MNKSNAFVLILLELWVDYHFLRYSRGIPNKTILNGIRLNERGESSSWKAVPNKFRGSSGYWIKYETIPISTLKNYGLEPSEKLIPFAQDIKEYRIDLEADGYKFNLEMALKTRETCFRAFYHEYSYPIEKIKTICRTHAVLHEIIESENQGLPLEPLFRAFQWLCGKYDLIFSTDSFRYFKVKLKKCRENSIEKTLVHHRKDRIGAGALLDPVWRYKIDLLWRDQSKPTKQMVFDQITKERIKLKLTPFSYSTILRHLNTAKVDYNNKFYRESEESFESNLLPYTNRYTRSIGQVWMIDGTKFPFPVKLPNGKIVILCMILVIDCYSKKIIGYQLNKSEKTDDILIALYRACVNCRHIARLTIHDSASGFTSKKFVQFASRLEMFGGSTRPSPPGRPRDKSHIERVNSTIYSSVFKGFKGYLGEGIKSKREWGRPTDNELKVIRKEHLRTPDQAILLLLKSIKQYNNKSFSGRPTPNEMYNSNHIKLLK